MELRKIELIPLPPMAGKKWMSDSECHPDPEYIAWVIRCRKISFYNNKHVDEVIAHNEKVTEAKRIENFRQHKINPISMKCFTCNHNSDEIAYFGITSCGN